MGHTKMVGRIHLLVSIFAKKCRTQNYRLRRNLQDYMYIELLNKYSHTARVSCINKEGLRRAKFHDECTDRFTLTRINIAKTCLFIFEVKTF